MGYTEHGGRGHHKKRAREGYSAGKKSCNRYFLLDYLIVAIIVVITIIVIIIIDQGVVGLALVMSLPDESL